MERLEGKTRRFGRPTAVEDLMDRSVRKGFLHFLSRRQKLREAWNDVVGEAAAKRTKIVSLMEGKLTVAVSGPAYLDRYRYMTKEWRRRLNVEFGEELIQELELRVGEVKSKDPPPSAKEEV
jgi:predicted nucleic acid-binding Zn ribbon protein